MGFSGPMDLLWAPRPQRLQMMGTTCTRELSRRASQFSRAREQILFAAALDQQLVSKGPGSLNDTHGPLIRTPSERSDHGMAVQPLPDQGHFNSQFSQP